MSIKVIGAGHGRTGTHSLKLALEELGFGRCYHMSELLEHPERIQHWEALYSGNPVDWNALFDGYQATVDYPANLCYQKILTNYPDAKVILTVRDPESWYDSVRSTTNRVNFQKPWQLLSLVLRLPFSSYLQHLMRVFKLAFNYWQLAFDGKFKNKAYAIQKYLDYNQKVQNTVPANNLLLYNIKDGWEPLCQFLNKPIPNTDFPHSNDRKSFHALQQQGMSPYFEEARRLQQASKL